MKRLVCMGILLATLGVIVAGPAQARWRSEIQPLLNSDGTGSMFVGWGTAPWTWEACTSKLKDCEPFAKGQEVQTAGAPAGTVFRVTDGEGEVGLSPVWLGALKAVVPPKVTGAIEANGFVSPVQGAWSGGWLGEAGKLQLSACITETGEQCVSISNPQRLACAPSASFSIDPVFAGWYLRVADWHVAGAAFTDDYTGPPPWENRNWGFEEVLRRSPTTAVAIVGQIAPPVNAPAGECGPPPAPTATIDTEGIARIECAAGCSVVLAGTRKGRRQFVTRQISEQSLLRPAHTLELKLPRTAMARLGTGKIRLTVEIDGTRWAQRTIRTPGS
jgi:hypothetical protein